MKNTIAIAALIAVLTILVPLGSMAQNAVMYPSDRYLNWQLDSSSSTVYYTNGNADCCLLFSGITEENASSIYIEGMRKMIFSDPFHYKKADSNTTHTIYGVAVSMIKRWGQLLDLSFPIDFAVYTGHEGDTTVTLVTRQSFYFDSGRMPDGWMFFSDTFAIPMYEFYFSHPITVTGLFFVGAGCGKDFPPEIIYVGMARPHGGYFCSAYTQVAICDDSLVQDYSTHWHWGGGSDWKISNYYGYKWGGPEWGFPGRRSIPIPDVDQMPPGLTSSYRMFTTQSFYPILQPRNTRVEEVAKPETLRLMPNPASERVTLVADRPIRNYRIVDMTGRTVLSGTLSSTATTMTLNIRILPRGIYCVQVETANGHHTQKLSVQ